MSESYTLAVPLLGVPVQ